MTIVLLFLLALSLLSLRSLVHSLRDDGYGRLPDTGYGVGPASQPPYAA
jgi:hypothetical protein